jgi:hypothetical protein
LRQAIVEYANSNISTMEFREIEKIIKLRGSSTGRRLVTKTNWVV